jgi:hypothetical protein
MTNAPHDRGDHGRAHGPDATATSWHRISTIGFERLQDAKRRFAGTPWLSTPAAPQCASPDVRIRSRRGLHEPA